MQQRFIFSAGLLLTLAACAVGPDHVRPGSPESPALERGEFLQADAVNTATPLDDWWVPLDDPVLTGLIEKGLANAPVVEAARARVRQARARVRMERAARLPVAGGSALYAYAELPDDAFGTSGGEEFYTLGFDAQWEADLWGGKKRATERAMAETGEANALLADAQVGLSAEIARAYVSWAMHEASLRLLDRQERIDQKRLAIAEARFAHGTAPMQAIGAARQQLAATQTERSGTAAEAAIMRDTLAVLIGDAPGALTLTSSATIPLPPAEVLVGDPAAMLARRPDVRAAEYRLAAETARIGLTQARRFPSISLLGLIGIGGSSVGDVFDTSQLSVLAVPRLSWSFLDFGRSAAAVRGAEASRDAALAEYQASVLAALQDAEAALARFAAARTALAKAVDARRDAASISRLQQLRAKAGTISDDDALEAAREEAELLISEEKRKADLILAYVSLAKSLGLGWQSSGASR